MEIELSTMASTTETSHNLETTRDFVKLCASKFAWGDLSEEIVMDIGCGKELYCARTILENFPKVKYIIALDNNPEEIEGITLRIPQIKPFCADILKWSDICQYEGTIVDKIISTYTIQQILNKEEAFENVYRLLKPGGQAAFLFYSDVGLHHVIEHLRLDSKYKDYYKNSGITILYSSQLKADHYVDVLQKIGFKVVEITDKEYRFQPSEFGAFEEGLHRILNVVFSLPPELILEMNKSSSNFYQETLRREKSFYLNTEMYIFVTKPSESSSGV